MRGSSSHSAPAARRAARRFGVRSSTGSCSTPTARTFSPSSTVSGRSTRPRRHGVLVKFGIFYEHQLPRPWEEGSELQLIQDALDQVELADKLGIQYVWEVEHHFLEEYSHSSAPEVFLAACSQRTKNMRLGHGIVQTP